MIKKIVIVCLLVFGFSRGCSFVLSENFQTYGDEGNKQWTCRVNDLLAEFYITLSDYDRSLDLYQRILNRCPKTRLEEKAYFKIAYCLESIGNHPGAIRQYRLFLEKYPRSERARLVQKKLQVLGS